MEPGSSMELASAGALAEKTQLSLTALVREVQEWEAKLQLRRASKISLVVLEHVDFVWCASLMLMQKQHQKGALA